jgi:hypothetical protein
MEEKYILEESTRKSLLRHSGDIKKVSTELSQPVKYVLKIHQKMKTAIMKNPDLNLQIAANITREILEGRGSRQQVYQDMLSTLDNREQLLVCVTCDTEVREMVLNSDEGLVSYCPKCTTVVQHRLQDRGEIFSQKQAILTALLNEDDKLMLWLTKMGWTGNEQPAAPTTIVNQRQNVLVLGETKLGTKEEKILDDLRHLPPLEAEKLRQDLKKKMITLDDEIRDTEENFEEA